MPEMTRSLTKEETAVEAEGEGEAEMKFGLDFPAHIQLRMSSRSPLAFLPVGCSVPAELSPFSEALR